MNRISIIMGRKKDLVSLPRLHKLALKKIFDLNNMNYLEEAQLQESLEGYVRKTDKTLQEIDELLKITQALEGNKHGMFDKVKENLVRHKIHYTRFYTVIG